MLIYGTVVYHILPTIVNVTIRPATVTGGSSLDLRRTSGGLRAKIHCSKTSVWRFLIACLDPLGGADRGRPRALQGKTDEGRVIPGHGRVPHPVTGSEAYFAPQGLIIALYG